MIIATKKAMAFSVVNTLKNKESGHHWRLFTISLVHCAVSTPSTHQSIQVTQKNKKDQYNIKIKDFNDAFTFSGSRQFNISLIHAITKYITSIANQTYLTTSRIWPQALYESHHGTRKEFG